LVEVLSGQLVGQGGISLGLSLPQLEADSLGHITCGVDPKVGLKLGETGLGVFQGGCPVATPGEESTESVLSVGTPRKNIPNNLFLGGMALPQAIGEHRHQLGDARGVESQAAELAV